MAGDYSEEWDDLHKLNRKLLRSVVVCATLLTLLVSVPFVNRAVPKTVASTVGMLFFAAWIFALIRLFYVVLEYRYFACPRCGKPFLPRRRRNIKATELGARPCRLAASHPCGGKLSR